MSQTCTLSNFFQLRKTQSAKVQTKCWSSTPTVTNHTAWCLSTRTGTNWWSWTREVSSQKLPCWASWHTGTVQRDIPSSLRCYSVVQQCAQLHVVVNARTVTPEIAMLNFQDGTEQFNKKRLILFNATARATMRSTTWIAPRCRPGSQTLSIFRRCRIIRNRSVLWVPEDAHISTAWAISGTKRSVTDLERPPDRLVNTMFFWPKMGKWSHSWNSSPCK